MKTQHLSLIAALACSTLAFADSQNSPAQTQNPDLNRTTADDSVRQTDPTVKADGDASTSARELSSGERRAVQKLGNLGEREVAISRIASERATNPEVKALAADMVREHQQVNSELSQFIQRRAVKVDIDDRTQVRSEEKKWLEKRGDDFDKDYLKALIDAHEDTIDALEKAADSKDAELSAWANKELPTVRMHLKRAEALKKQIK